MSIDTYSRSRRVTFFLAAATLLITLSMWLANSLSLSVQVFDSPTRHPLTIAPYFIMNAANGSAHLHLPQHALQEQASRDLNHLSGSTLSAIWTELHRQAGMSSLAPFYQRTSRKRNQLDQSVSSRRMLAVSSHNMSAPGTTLKAATVTSHPPADLSAGTSSSSPVLVSEAVKSLKSAPPAGRLRTAGTSASQGVTLDG